MSNPSQDIIVFGATSFVGQILCQYLFDEFKLSSSLRWAMAGRSLDKLEQLRRSLGSGAENVSLVVANSADEAELRLMVAQARVVISTVGPYALYGELLIKVCAETGTDYCDLTGEAQWIRLMIERYEVSARLSGARIVNCCGFDSIPSDLGVFFLQQESLRRFGVPCTQINMRVRSMRGAISGGTAASLLNVIKEASENLQLRKELANPYSLCLSAQPVMNPGIKATVRQPNISSAQFDNKFKAWVAPFIMSGINTRIVHRSHFLNGYPYGLIFKYDEAVLTGRGWRGALLAFGTSIGLGVFVLASALKPLRIILQRFVLPKLGEGPTQIAQARGFFDLRFLGSTLSGENLQIKVTGDRDPGYGSTAKMLGQAAACLALEISPEMKAGGFWTPATIFGDSLIQRLKAKAGLRFELLP